MKRTIWSIAGVVIVIAAAALAGCAGDQPLSSKLDERGQTWVGPDLMVTLARATPRYSVAARDYLYVAPVEANSMGARRQYLWLGLATTVDGAWRPAAPARAASLLVVADGLPVALSLGDWESGAGTPKLATPAPVYEVHRARVTFDQLARILAASAVEVQVVREDGAVERYDLWDGSWNQWRAFVPESDAADRRAAQAR